ncbi:MAG: zinc ribbon domain-containing protein [Chloroflexota bacterium]|nr:zinc ribbon domain-containing protein [Chloroflexota bacterium]
MAKAHAHHAAHNASHATQVCPTCGKSVVPSDGYCPACGSPIQVAGGATLSGASSSPGTVGVPPTGSSASAHEAALLCPVCGSSNPPGTEYCVQCGALLAQALATTSTGAVAVPKTGFPPHTPVPVGRNPTPSSSNTSSTSTAVPCAICGHAIPVGEDYCPNCGAPASTSAAVQSAPDGAAHQAKSVLTNCPNCGAVLRPGARFCRECGTRFDDLPGKQKESGPAGGGPQPLGIGQTLAGRYKLVSAIGGGGMGTVFKGVDTHLTSRQDPEGRPVAVKAILDTSDPELLAAAVEEREMLVRLDNPNIVRIFDIVEQGGTPYIVMAFVQGTSWKEIYDSNGGPLPETEALRLLLGIHGAFDYLHHRTPPVVYRDFKPGNVIQVTEPNGSQRQVLIDLGTAMEYFPGQKREAWGTAGFAPPEIGGICEQSPSMDLFGIVSTLAALLGVDVEKQPLGVPSHRDWPVSEEIYDFVARGRDPDPRVRFGTVDELFDQLEGINRFVRGQASERAMLSRVAPGGQNGSGMPGGGGLPGGIKPTRSLSAAMVPVHSTIITGKLFSTSGKIGALPTPSSTDPAQQLLQPVRDLVEDGRYVDALNQLDAVLKVHPASIDGHLLRATALNNLGRTDEAQAALAQANRLGTPATRWRTLLVAAQAADGTGDNAGAEKLYQELIRLVPGEVLPKQALADVYRREGNYERAADFYSRVVAADPANADAVLGWADSLVALNKTDVAISVLDAVNENALRYVDAQLRLVELYLVRIGSYMDGHPDRLRQGTQGDQDVHAMLSDLGLAGRGIAALTDRTESGHFYRMLADWWYLAYRLAKAKLLPPDMTWPDSSPQHANTPESVGKSTREAYRRYLQRVPSTPDREAVLARIYFDVREWQ